MHIYPNLVPSEGATSDPSLWHLVCVTKKSGVSILRNLDIETARASYRVLKPDERPIRWIESREEDRCNECVECRHHGQGYSIMAYSSFHDDARIEKVEIIGPTGRKLEPWLGQEPRVVDNRFVCERKAEARREEERLEREAAEREWLTRKDFWNYPGRWEGVADPHREPMRLPDVPGLSDPAQCGPECHNPVPASVQPVPVSAHPPQHAAGYRSFLKPSEQIVSERGPCIRRW